MKDSIDGATEAAFPNWFGDDGGVLGIIRRCVIHVDGDAWLSDGRCAFLMRPNGLKTLIVKDFADVIRTAIRNATVNVSEGHIMFEPDTKANQLGYSARNFVVEFGNRTLRGLHVALVRKLYGELRWSMNPNDESSALVAWAGGRPVAIIMPII